MNAQQRARGRAGRLPPADPTPTPPGGLRPVAQPRRWREWPITAVLVGIGASLAVVAADHFKKGSVMLALSVLLGAGLRLVLPKREAGLLAVRGRVADVLTLGILGACLLVLALNVHRPS